MINILSFRGLKKYPAQLSRAQIALVLLSYLHVGSSAKILFYLGSGSQSHRVAAQPLITQLAENGHEVTVLSPNKPEVENPKVKEYCPQSILDYDEQIQKDFADNPVVARLNDRNFDPFLQNSGALMWKLYYQVNTETLISKEFQEWLKSSTFDLIFTEYPGKEISLVLGHLTGAKVIAFSPAPLWPIDADLFGFPTEASWYSGWTLGSPYKLIPDQFYHEAHALLWHFSFRWNYLSKLDAFLKNLFQEEIPPLETLMKNVKLLFLNTHFSSEYARSLPPFVVPVGGMHVKKTSQPLPKNLEDFVSSGSDGFIFISFGSLAQISGLPPDTQKSFFDAIASFQNARFLLKWDGEIPKDLPKNVLPLKWFPQQDLLTHHRCRGFVSQGGLMSFQQATYNGVPVVIMPLFGDQPFNAKTAAHQGTGIHLELADLTFDTFSDAIRQLLFSASLSARAKEVAKRFKDRPMSPLDTAVWWTEYVLRHNDTSHLKPLSVNQEWWQRRMLDFWALVFSAILLIALAVFFVIRSTIRVSAKSADTSQTKKIKRS